MSLITPLILYTHTVTSNIKLIHKLMQGPELGLEPEVNS